MPCFSHPNKLLSQHLDNVREIGLTVFRGKSRIVLPLGKKDVEIALSLLLYYHDLGKATLFFQDYLKASINNEQYKGRKEILIRETIEKIHTDDKP